MGYRYSDKGRRKLLHNVINIPITWHHTPEDWNVHCHYCDDLRSHKSLFSSHVTVPSFFGALAKRKF
jgi:hypothetical protein